MNYLDQWQAIAARITGLRSAAELHVSLIQARAGDTYDRGGYLAGQCAEVLVEIESFQKQFENELPPAAAKVIATFLKERGPLFREAVKPGGDVKDEKSRAVIVLLPALETQVSYCMRNVQPLIRARSELAFAHLQRSIVADQDVQAKWQRAYHAGETHCEALGATHLLSHGIYAFKVNAEKARTDLVFQDQTVGEAPIYAEGMVLTEWKKATKNAIDDGFAAARRQAHLYVPRVFSGKELTGYRYAVVVSDEMGPIPADITIENIVYRHILIPLSQPAPSVQARMK